MKSETRLPHRKRVWPLLVLLLLLMFWFSRQTATVSPASGGDADGPSEARLAAVAADDLTGGDLSPFGGPDETPSWPPASTTSPSAPAAASTVSTSAILGTPSSAPARQDLVAAVKSPAMAQVDLAQLLAAHPPLNDTPEARQAALQRIRQEIAQQASAHGFMVVMDRSMQDEWGVPMVLSARGLFDLTAAVEQELKR